MLNLDSLHKSGVLTAHFEDNDKRAAVSPGLDQSVYYSNSTGDTSAAADSAHFIIRYDAISLTLHSMSAMNSWQLVNSIAQPGLLEVWLRSTGTLNTLPLLSTTFSTALADTVAKVYLEDPVIFSHRKNCDCAVTNNPGSDSVEIDFTGCGGPTLWRYMQTGQIFDLLSVSPNPASQTVTVELENEGEGAVAAEVMDVLGGVRLTASLSDRKTPIDVSALPAGTYLLRLSESGEVRTRRFVVER